MSNATTFEDVWKLFQETDRKIREQSAETDRKICEQSAETDRKIREQSAKTDRLVKEVSRQIGNLGGKWGEFVENLVAPGCETLFAEWGIPVHQVHQRVRGKRDDGDSLEIDILVVNGDSVVLVEVKSTLTVDDIRQHLQRLQRFKLFFPQYAACRVLGAVAGIVTEENAERFAHNQGLFVIVQSGEGVALANQPDFEPRAW